MALAQTLRAARDGRGWSRAKLAAESGVSETYIEAIERGDRGKRVSASVVQKLSRALEVQPGDLAAEYAGLNHTELSPEEMFEELRRRFQALDLVNVRVDGYVPSQTVGEIRGQTPDYIQVPRALVEKEGPTVFALEVGEGLPEEGIYLGDYVIVKPGVAVDDGGGIFVVEVDGARVLRRVRKAGPHVHVRPAIGDQTTLPTSDISVVGKVIAGGRWREF